ncbi:MAG: dihydroorotase [Candidatus Bipolaricaulota bacterium]
MSYRFKLRSRNVYYDGEFRNLEVGIKDGEIAAVGTETGKADEVIDLEENLVIPGVIDGHVHFRDPGETAKEDFRSGSRAAARGGVTTVVDMPNNQPPIKSAELFEEKKRIAGKKSLVNFALYAGIPKDLSEIPALVDSGAVGFKYYMAEEEVDLAELSGRIEDLEALLTVHAEVSEELNPQGPPGSPEEYLDSRPPRAELKAMEKLLEVRPARLHLAHVTLPETVWKAEGTASKEVTPHHLLLSRSMVGLKDFTAVTNPPIRDAETVKDLKESFLDGRIGMLASDHAPHLSSEKLTKKPSEASPGIPGVETLVPLSLTFARESGSPLSLAVDALTKNPAELFGFERRGRIKEGYRADITVLDGDKSTPIRGDDFLSKAKVTPFEGREVSFWPKMTIVNGTPVYRDGKITDEGAGEFLRGGD